MVVKAEANGIGGKNGRTTVAVKMLKGLFLFKNCISYIEYATFILANSRNHILVPLSCTGYGGPL